MNILKSGLNILELNGKSDLVNKIREYYFSVKDKDFINFNIYFY